MSRFRIVTIDGGAATGKSSTGKLLCEKYNFLHVDTGAHYRAITYACIQDGVAPVLSSKLVDALLKIDLGTTIRNKASFISINGSVLSDSQIRSDLVNAAVSHFSAIAEVREKLKTYQRYQVQVAQENGFNGLVMDGRDIGTIIFPDADLKVFLSADSKTRAERRLSDGQVDQINTRDQMDSQRATAPLVSAPDAKHLDNSDLSLEEVVKVISSWMDSL